METSPNVKLFVDNATIAGAGHALYDNRPSKSDSISLAHFITTALLADELHIDGSSRLMPFKYYDLDHNVMKHTNPVGAIWTWEKRYPAWAEMTFIRDNFLQRQLGFDQTKIVEYLLKLRSYTSKESLTNLDLTIIPSACLAKDYLDL